MSVFVAYVIVRACVYMAANFKTGYTRIFNRAVYYLRQYKIPTQLLHVTVDIVILQINKEP